MQHILAVLISAAFLAVIPVVLYVSLIIWANDLGGPLNLIVIPFVSGILGLFTSVIVFLPVSFVAERSNPKMWLQVVGGLSALLIVGAGVAWAMLITAKVRTHGSWMISIGISFCLCLACGFFVYLGCLVSARSLLTDDK